MKGSKHEESTWEHQAQSHTILKLIKERVGRARFLSYFTIRWGLLGVTPQVAKWTTRSIVDNDERNNKGKHLGMRLGTDIYSMGSVCAHLRLRNPSTPTMSSSLISGVPPRRRTKKIHGSPKMTTRGSYYCSVAERVGREFPLCDPGVRQSPKLSLRLRSPTGDLSCNQDSG